MNKTYSPIIDFHIHPGPACLPTERRLHERENIEGYFDKLLGDMKQAEIDRAVVMLLDEDWFRTDAGHELMYLYQSKGWEKSLVFCAMFDVYRPYEIEQVLKNVECAAYLGVKGIKIHAVLQRLTELDFLYLSALIQKAEKLGMFIVVHAYSEVTAVFDNKGLEIAAYIAAKVSVPVIIAHAGGIDFSRVVFLAQEHANIMIDLSYFYKLEHKLGVKYLIKWGIDVLGAERFLYGSDHPSCELGVYKIKLLRCLHEIGLNEVQIGMIMGQNAFKILT